MSRFDSFGVLYRLIANHAANYLIILVAAAFPRRFRS
jgi:hypothetical protein